MTNSVYQLIDHEEKQSDHRMKVVDGRYQLLLHLLLEKSKERERKGTKGTTGLQVRTRMMMIYKIVTLNIRRLGILRPK